MVQYERVENMIGLTRLKVTQIWADRITISLKGWHRTSSLHAACRLQTFIWGLNRITCRVRLTCVIVSRVLAESYHLKSPTRDAGRGDICPSTKYSTPDIQRFNYLLSIANRLLVPGVGLQVSYWNLFRIS